jgi:hypothetical protein
MALRHRQLVSFLNACAGAVEFDDYWYILRRTESNSNGRGWCPERTVFTDFGNPSSVVRTEENSSDWQRLSAKLRGLKSPAWRLRWVRYFD